MQPPAQPVPAGWYQDPGNPAALRWWDGAGWTGHVRQRQQQWAPDKATATPDGVPLASLGARLLARIVDSVLLSAVQLGVIAPFLPGALRSMFDYLDTHQQELEQGTLSPYSLYTQTGLLRLFAVALVGSVVLSAVYTITFVRLRGATPGKGVAGVRVRPWQTEGRPTWGQATQRWLTGELPGALIGLYLLIDYLWPCWDERRQALHDKWPGTVVVAGRRR